MRKGKIYCPYYKDGECGLEKPLEGCQDFVISWGGMAQVNQNTHVMMKKGRRLNVKHNSKKC